MPTLGGIKTIQLSGILHLEAASYEETGKQRQEGLGGEIAKADFLRQS